MSRNRTNYNSRYNKEKYTDYTEKKVENYVESTEDFTDKEAESYQESIEEIEPYEEPVNDATTVVFGKVNIPEKTKLNVRSAPSYDAEPLTTINPHSEVVILEGREDNTEWYKVCTASGVEGYVLKEYITNIHNTIV